MEGTGYKQYLRWKNFASPRIDENGEMTEYLNSVNNYYSSSNKSTSSNYNWNYTGPKGLFETPITGTGKGWVNRLLVDESDRNIIYAGTHNSGLWRTTDGGLNWYMLTAQYPQINGIASIIKSNDANGTIYIATSTNISNYSNGIFKSEDNGTTWSELSIEYLDGGVLKTLYPSPNLREIPRKIIEHPSETNILFLLTESSAYKSIDKGVSWTRVFHEEQLPTWNGIRYNDIIFDNRDYNIMYIGGYKVHKTTDGGNTWTDQTYELTEKNTLGFCTFYNYPDIDQTHPNYGDMWFLYSYIKNNPDPENWFEIAKFDKSSDEFIVLDNHYNSSQTYGLNGHKNNLFVDPNDENRIIVGGLQVYALINNGTTTWDSYPITRRQASYVNYVHDDIRDLYFYITQSGQDRLIIACDAGVSIGYNQSSTSENWIFNDVSVKGNDRQTDLNINEVYAISTNHQNGNMMFNCQDVGGYEIANGIITSRLHGGDGGGILYDDKKPDYHYTYEYQVIGTFWLEYRNEEYDQVHETNDNGNEVYGIGNGDGLYFAPIKKDPSNANILYTGVKKLFKLTDVYNSAELGTVTLDNEEPVLDENTCDPIIDKYNTRRLTDIKISKSNPNIMFVSTNRNFAPYNTCESDPTKYGYALFKSTDTGANWDDISANILGLTNGYITNITINPNNENEVWLCFAKATKNADAQTTKKVYKSTDGGQNFTAFSDDLPEAIPVWDMEYDSYTDILYIATDIGIFSRPADGSSNWVDITENNGSYPVIMVTDIEINYKNRKLYAATFGRGIWETSLGDCPEYVNTDTEITGVQEWNEPHSINTNLIINPGATLTIKDAVYFNSGSRFIIREGENGTEGGHLILDGAVLTNGCDENYWKGIEVWGNGYEDQNPLYQGWITMKNNSVISNAEIGILANNSVYQNAAFNYHGGIVHLSNSTFINNIVSVQLEDYHHQTFNQINNCEFITDENWAHYGASPDRFISYSNYGYEIDENGRSYKQEVKGCSFENFRYADDITQSDKWGKGIYAYNTRLVVDNLEIQDGFETWYKLCEFKHLYIGVNAIGDEVMLPITVSNSLFEQNKEALNLFYIFNAEITLNDIEVLNITDSHGLYLNNSTDFHIEENNFWADGNSTENYGLIVYNSGSSPNLIYNNTFQGLYYSTSAQGENSNKTTGEGLQFKCNQYQNNIVDITVFDDNVFPGFGIAEHQGKTPDNNADYTSLAGNIFTDEVVYTDHLWDIYNKQGENRFTYHYYLPLDPDEPKTNPSIQKVFSVSGYPITLFLSNENQNLDLVNYTYEKNCPSTVSSNNGVVTTKSLVQTYSQLLDSISTDIATIKDGGETPYLFYETENAMTGEEFQTKNMLLNNSPNLSDSVMISSIENENALQNAMLRDVLTENPRAAKSNEIQSALDVRANQLPDYMRDEIDQSGDTLSELEIKRAALAYYNLKKQIELSNLIKFYRKDTITIKQKDSIINVFELMGNVDGEYRKAMLYLATKDTSSADSIVLAMNTKFNLDNSKIEEKQSFVDFINIKKRIIRDSLCKPDSVALSGFEQINNTGFGLAVNISQSYLYEGGLIDIYYPHYKIDSITTKSAKRSNGKDNLEMYEEGLGKLRVKPNPAKNYFIVEYELPDKTSHAILKIQSLNGINCFSSKVNGKKNEIAINSEKMTSGIYIVTLESGFNVLLSCKVNIVK